VASQWDRLPVVCKLRFTLNTKRNYPDSADQRNLSLLRSILFVNCFIPAYTACATKFNIGFHSIKRYFIDIVVNQRSKGAEPIMKTLLLNFVQDEQGQDLIEYTLLLAFVCLASAALFISAGGSVSGIWSATNSRLTVANTSAS
jgi:Flp pilus assembly pilin Flp